ncbi:hypothetical protein N0V87_002293 [Didymella glomerata]|uniref:Uncharacterized protein n=1 Tax=Didymella glomerata TaxID=749621 RepID=A0A9W8X5T4_9PLEO|nr:hypothetical protein N0V87_002293 [Didymella glomerata]
MDATAPANNAADAFIKVICQSDPMAPDLLDKLFRAVRDVAGCTREELPEIARAMAQSHKDNAACIDKALKLV